MKKRFFIFSKNTFLIVIFFIFLFVFLWLLSHTSTFQRISSCYRVTNTLLYAETSRTRVYEAFREGSKAEYVFVCQMSWFIYLWYFFFIFGEKEIRRNYSILVSVKLWTAHNPRRHKREMFLLDNIGSRLGKNKQIMSQAVSRKRKIIFPLNLRKNDRRSCWFCH